MSDVTRQLTPEFMARLALSGGERRGINALKAELSIEGDRRACAKSFPAFVRLAWPVLEPATRLEWGWSLDAICDHLVAVHDGEIIRLLINCPPGMMKSILVGVLFPAWEWGPARQPYLRYLATAHKQDLAVRDNLKCRRLITSPWYQARWPVVLTGDQNAKTKFENEDTGFREAMAFQSMTGSRGDRVLLDDPLSVDESNSDADRLSAELTFTESLPTRVNNDRSAIVVIMQRLHERDTSGIILARELPYVHLVLPMEFEADRRCSTSIGFVDPREEDGELLFPERFGLESLEVLKAQMGSYACTPGESPVLMADLTSKSISEVVVGDEVVGFEAAKVLDSAGYARQHLTASRVTKVFKYQAPVVLVSLDSGRDIRCTPDHKWYKKQRNDGNNYSKAVVGSSLTRVCPASLPILTTPEDLRAAGWLAGFFDGDGSVSFARRHDNCRPVSQIKFYQGAGRNGPNCDYLEACLERFGFEYSVATDTRKDPSKGVNFEYRCYTLTGQSLPLMQKFLHLVQPVKWRDRMVEGAYGAKFVQGRERVVSIEPDGSEDVFALETETGNYIVWGLASSNSAGQLQQRPAPREGGMFKRHWFEMVDAIPNGGVKVRGWDLAATEAKKARSGTAYTAGVHMTRVGDVFYVTDVARIRGSAHDVEKLLLSTAGMDGFDCEVSLPQDPGSAGKSYVRYLVARLAGFNARFSTESGSKEMRAQPFSAQAEAGNVKVLNGVWNDAFFEELMVFPNGAYMDQVDASSRAFARLAHRRMQNLIVPPADPMP